MLTTEKSGIEVKVGVNASAGGRVGANVSAGDRFGVGVAGAWAGVPPHANMVVSMTLKMNPIIILREYGFILIDPFG
jgi:uncharacterized spore protein YtfJ